MILAKAVKLSEEVWELNSEVLKKLYNGRKIFLQEDLELEFADVIITTLLLAKSLNVDINDSLNKKLNILNERWWI
jgi:NTP pyrophosphatase (non-canonical NTP hydrolase)